MPQIHRAASVIQPWAMLIATRDKRFETRSWYTDYRGEFYIHASKKYPDTSFYMPAIKSALFQAGYRTPEDLPIGQLIAKGNLVNCLRIYEYPAPPGEARRVYLGPGAVEATRVPERELPFGDYHDGRFAWVLEDMDLLDQPIPMKGALGIWRFEEDAGEYRNLGMEGRS